MTALEVYELTTRGGASDFARVIAACESFAPYCLIGGLAVNCYVEPVYTLDADIVIIAANMPRLSAHLRDLGFGTEEPAHSVKAQASESDIRIQFTTDERYQRFLVNAIEAEVLGVPVKLWAYSDPHLRLSKRKKDELDLIRLADVHPELKSQYPAELREQLDRG